MRTALNRNKKTDDVRAWKQLNLYALTARSLLIIMIIVQTESMCFSGNGGTGGNGCNGEGGEIKQTFDSECFSLCFWSWLVSKYEQKPLILAFSHVSKIKTFLQIQD